MPLPRHEVSPPIPATALVVDLRNFTPHLNASRCDDDGVHVFCRFLSDFYGLCLELALLALPPALRDRAPPLSVSSTGDGVIVVFTDPEAHALHGFLTALLLHEVLDRTCAAYNVALAPGGVPPTGFGIGLESGEVTRIRARATNDRDRPLVDTWIGECINVASRAQELSKLLHRARTIVAEDANARLCRLLFDADYRAMNEEAGSFTVVDATRLALHNRMLELNRSLCVAFIHQHQLRGVPRPLALFRVSESAARLGNPRFEALLERLVRGDRRHLDEVFARMR